MHNISTRVVCVNGKHREPMGSCKYPLWYIQIGPFELEKKAYYAPSGAWFFFQNYAQNFAFVW